MNPPGGIADRMHEAVSVVYFAMFAGIPLHDLGPPA